MALSEKQLDWLVEHFAYPGRAYIKPPLLEQSLIDLGLVNAEVFPYDDGFDVIVLSPTKGGWAAAVQHRPDEVKQYYDMFDDRFIREAEMINVSMAQLPEFLSSDDDLTRDVAAIQLDKLLKDKSNG